MLRIMVVDDHEVVRVGMRSVLEMEPDIQFVGEAADGEEALNKIPNLLPDLVLMDVRMQKIDGIEACKQIKERYLDVKVVMITSYTDNNVAYQAASAGANGYLLKNLNRSELLQAIRRIAGGEILIDIDEDDVSPDIQSLTEREREVLVLIARGYTNRQIAESLVVSEKTARNHVSNILVKLGLTRRSEAAVFAVEHKFIPPKSS